MKMVLIEYYYYIKINALVRSRELIHIGIHLFTCKVYFHGYVDSMLYKKWI